MIGNAYVFLDIIEKVAEHYVHVRREGRNHVVPRHHFVSDVRQGDTCWIGLMTAEVAKQEGFPFVEHLNVTEKATLLDQAVQHLTAAAAALEAAGVQVHEVTSQHVETALVSVKGLVIARNVEQAQESAARALKVMNSGR